jgi:hypothetical protein
MMSLIDDRWYRGVYVRFQVEMVENVTILVRNHRSMTRFP